MRYHSVAAYITLLSIASRALIVLPHCATLYSTGLKMSKQFGLIIPGQQKKPVATRAPPAARPSVFDESSNSDDDDAGPTKLAAMRKTGIVDGPSLMERRVARNMQAKALAEDPTIFQYDELYDEMDNKRVEAKESKKQEPRKAKYISRLMEHAERRKLENELRIERQVQKDREAEGEKFKDKDTYVTSAYRKKLESIRQLQEQDERDEYLEAIGDVTKQKDLDGFYRHLYEQKLGTQKPKAAGEEASSSKQRSYRKRRLSAEDEQPVEAEVKKSAGSEETKAHLANNIDADSDFSIDESSDEEEEKKEKEQPKTTAAKSSDGKDKSEPENQQKSETQNDTNAAASDQEQDKQKQQEQQEPIAVVKTPVDRTLIWRKRTVGEVFDAALARYHQRKLARRA